MAMPYSGINNPADDEVSQILDTIPPHGYKIQWCSLDELEVDHTYQRDLGPAKVGQMTGWFKPHLIPPLIVSHRITADGKDKYYLIDGQHRYEALKQIGYQYPVPCLVFEDLTPEQEAALFYLYNTSATPANAKAKYRALRACRSRRLQRIEQLAQQYGFNLDPNSKDKKALRAIGALLRVAKKDTMPDLPLVDKTLSVLAALRLGWKDKGHKAREGAMIEAVATFFAIYPNADGNRLVQKLSTRDPDVIMSNANNAYNNYGVRKSQALVGEMLVAYNSSLPSSHQLAPSLLPGKTKKIYGQLAGAA